MDDLLDLVVDDSHGYCQVSSQKGNSEQIFSPVIIKHIAKTEDLFDENTLEYYFYQKKYDLVVRKGEILLPKLPKNAIRRNVLEMLTRSYVHLSNKEKALEYLKCIVDENHTEDAGRDYLRMWTYEKLEMFEESIESSRDYLKVRSGDQNAVQIIIRCINKLNLDATEWKHTERQILHCYSRPNHVEEK